MKIALDILGGDYAPHEPLSGAVKALKKNTSLELVLVGDRAIIEPAIAGKYEDRVEIIHTTDSISNEDQPTVAIRKQPNSSMVLGLSALRERDDIAAFVSAGCTGALLTGAFMKIGRIEGVSRPALCPFLPNMKGGRTMLIDCGANVDCKPQNLAHFALMGTAYLNSLGVKNPRVGLVSVGTEDAKGNEQTLATFPLLKSLSEKGKINFVGNMEARDAFSGDYDILVCDGFVGNVLLKTAEGAFKLLTAKIKRICKTSARGMMGGLLLNGKMKKMKRSVSDEAVGGTIFIGVKKTVVKAHGNSKRIAIANAINVALDASQADLSQHIRDALEGTEELLSVK